MEFSAQMIAGFLKGTVEGDPDVMVSDVSKIEEGRKGTLSFLANPKYHKYIYDTESSIVLVNSDLKLDREVKATLIRVEDAYKAFAQLLALYEQSIPKKTGHDSQVSISSSASVGENCYLGAFAVLGDNVKIGNNVRIYPHVFLDDNVIVDDGTTIYSGVKVYRDCKIGKNCIIHSSTVIGSDGFGFAPDGQGGFEKIPQLGNVVLEDNVEIGSNCSIDRATMGSTIIKRGVKLDNLIQVAHNVVIGENTVIAAQTGIAGSTKLGREMMVGGQSGFINHLTIADKVIMAPKTTVSKNVTKVGEVLYGNPAVPISLGRRIVAARRNLPDMFKRLGELEHTVEKLKNNK